MMGVGVSKIFHSCNSDSGSSRVEGATTSVFLVRIVEWLCVLLLIGFNSATVSGEDTDWAQKMLDRKDFNFQVVAKGADASLRLRIENVYKEEIQITNATTGCGCVSWDEKTFPLVIPSGQSLSLTLRLDTVRFDGERKSKAKLFFLGPAPILGDEVEFPVEGYIRKDIVVSPGAVNFGAVDVGKAAEQRVAVTYAGRPDWKIELAEGKNTSLVTQLVEKSRGNGLVNYELIVALKPEAPAGNLRDQITLITNDVNNPKIPVLVEARVEPDIVVSDLQFGAVSVGQSRTMNVVIRGKTPFKIEKIERTKADSSFRVKTPAAIAAVYSLPLTFAPPNQPGPFDEEFFVTISGRKDPVTFKAKARILAQDATK